MCIRLTTDLSVQVPFFFVQTFNYVFLKLVLITLPFSSCQRDPYTSFGLHLCRVPSSSVRFENIRLWYPIHRHLPPSLTMLTIGLPNFNVLTYFITLFLVQLRSSQTQIRVPFPNPDSTRFVNITSYKGIFNRSSTGSVQSDQFSSCFKVVRTVMDEKKFCLSRSLTRTC